jgi:hypothetical protein
MKELQNYIATLQIFINDGHKLMIKLPSDKNRQMNDALTLLTKAKHTLDTINNG